MDKSVADNIISEYLNKIHSFALSKTSDIDTAEELASRIIFEVYNALLKHDNIHNVRSYIYRIARNILSRFLLEEKTNKDIIKQKSNDPARIEKSNDIIFEKIRKEIAYLSNLQREIAVMYYFEKQKVKDIAKRLNLSTSLVTWHLFDARNTIKDSLKDENETKSYTEETVFSRIYQFGSRNILGTDISAYFSQKITQNIVYSAYHKPKNAVEIAKELAVPVAFVEDEISFLVDNGYMNKMAGKQYQTNIYIMDLKAETKAALEKVYKKYAKIYCEKYIPQLFKVMKECSKHSEKLYIPENDFNFLMWNIVTFSLSKPTFKKELHNYCTRRKDGGYNIGIAEICERNTNSLPKHDLENRGFTIDFFSPENYLLRVWMYFSRFDSRVEPINYWIGRIFETLYEYLTRRIKKEPIHINKFINLYESGLLVPSSKNPTFDNDLVNILVTSMSIEELESYIPIFSDDLDKISKQFDEELYEINRPHYPPQMQKFCHYSCQNAFYDSTTRNYVLEYLLQIGLLKPLKKYQKRTVNMIMCSDEIPIDKSFQIPVALH